MKKLIILAFLLICFFFKTEGAVYDCFIFVNELEALEIRLNELAPSVEKFIIIECNENFLGQKKPYYYENNQEYFSKFKDKIIYLKVKGNSKNKILVSKEEYLWNSLLPVLKSFCKERDIILISSVEEIPSLKEINNINTLIGEHKHILFSHEHYKYSLNIRLKERHLGASCCRFAYLKEMSPYFMRVQGRVSKIFLPTYNSGWFFSSLSNIEKLFEKGELSRENFDISSWYESLSLMPITMIDESFPQYVRDNQSYFYDLGCSIMID